MDETPELPPETEVLAEGVPVTEAVEPPPPATLRTLTRDALMDLGAALGVGFCAIFLGAIVGGVVFALTANNPRQIVDMAASPWGIAVMLLATQLPLLYFGLRRMRRNREKQRPAMELFAVKPGNTVVLGVFAGLGLTVLSAVYSGTLQKVLGPESVKSQVEFLQDILDNRAAVALLVVIIAGLAPVCEELFFRGVIFGSAHAAGLSKAGVAISAVCFAAVHLSVPLAPFYAAFAVVMCWLYVRTGTLAAPIAAHMTMNSVACAALLLAGGNRV